MTEPIPKGVPSRRVLIIAGYDPMPRRRHREHYRREGMAQAALADYALTVTADPQAAHWDVTFDDGAQRGHAQIAQLQWDDLVAEDLAQSRWRILIRLLCAMWRALSPATNIRFLRLRRGPVLVFLYVVMGICLWASLWLGICLTVGWLGGWGAGVAACVATLVLEPRAFARLDTYAYLKYLAADFGFWFSKAGAYPEVLQQRQRAWLQTLTHTMAEHDGDVLLVGHSSGAQLAVSLLADYIRSQPQGARLPSLLTLGQVIPMVSLLPQAQRLRDDLTTLAQTCERGALTWVDVSAPGDPCCFALCDPVAISGCGPKDMPLILSAAFQKNLRPDRQRKLAWRFLQRHRLYLSAFDTPEAYDFFRITAGPQTLRAYVAGRHPSPQRLSALRPFAFWRVP